MICTGLASANLLEVKKAVEEAICKKLATEYANDPNTFAVHSIAQLQICLAQTLKNTTSTAIPRNFDIQTPPFDKYCRHDTPDTANPSNTPSIY